MNQIKYLIYACLLLFCCAIIFYIFKAISSAKSARQNTSVVLEYPDTNVIKIEKILSKGKLLFQQNCEMCHSTKSWDAYALYGFTKRSPWTDMENVYAWIKNPAAFMKYDTYAKSMVHEYNVIMPAFPALKREEIDEIVNYINSTPARSGNVLQIE